MGARLTTVEKFYIDSHPDAVVADLAKVLKQPAESVEKYLKAKAKAKESAVPETVAQPPEASQVQRLVMNPMHRPRPGVAIMTGTLSGAIDDFKNPYAAMQGQIAQAVKEERYDEAARLQAMLKEHAGINLADPQKDFIHSVYPNGRPQ